MSSKSIIVPNLTEQNFFLYAAHNYDNVGCTSIEEFEEDIKRFQYLKKLLGKYKETGVLKNRLILNHIIILQNVFGNEQAVRMLFLKLKDFYCEFSPFLVYLNTLPDVVKNINGININTANVILNSDVVKKLRDFNNELEAGTISSTEDH
jgi:hypothetical protein